MTSDTIFDVASLTKVLATTPAIMLLWVRGQVNLDAPVCAYIHEFTNGGKERITVRQLLTHTSGLPEGISTRPKWEGAQTAIKLACAVKLKSEPGREFLYSDINFILLGEIVARISCEPFNKFCDKEIFLPLKMTNTCFLPGADETPRIAPTEKVEGAVLRGAVHDPTARFMGGVAGNAGVFTTASDLARFARMMLNLGELDGVRIFKPETVQMMTSVQTPSGMSDRRGFGWDIDSVYSGARGSLFPIGSYGHTGFTGCALWIDPFSKTFSIFLSNRVHPDGGASVVSLYRAVGTLAAEAVADFDFKPFQPVDATSLHKKVLVGYQGWFHTGTSWDHWNRDWSRPPSTNALQNITFEMWPDVSDYTHTTPIPGFTSPDGSPARLYRADDAQIVNKHFDWMRQYGIDGAVVQRFIIQTPPDNVQAWKSNVLQYVRNAANRTGRVYCLEYDMSAANPKTLFAQLTNDWTDLATDLKITHDSRYLHHNGKPVLMIFGFYPERFSNTDLPEQIIAWFKTNTNCPVTLIGSGAWNWRRKATGDWTNIYRSFDGYCPWNTGNCVPAIINGAPKKYANTSYWPGDIKVAKKVGMFYLPQVYPGFSWDNLKQLPPGKSNIPRLGGDFLWKQFYDAARDGLDAVYVGMFDEVDEGTAIYKVSNIPPPQAHFVTYDGLPADWYLRLTGEGAKMIRGKIPVQRAIPIQP
jgi:CubicO group peptidase (beta-lactamase class C family)